jgi:2'-5' RNA ligase
MRLFICIDLEQDQLDAVNRLKTSLKKESNKGRFTKPEHMHLTLNFLGEVEDERLGDVIQAMDTVDFNKFVLHMSGLGWFQKRSGKIYWVGLERNEELQDLQRCLHNALSDRGFELEKREYTPHITVGRDVKVADDFNPSRYTEMVQGMSIKVDRIILKKSENKGSGIIHTVLYSKAAIPN